ncbi:branched-chain amino acid ABC transporter substrate-binding protein [Azospirillum sp.]|uniref:branched-chain amino acid ABC transporter substrate-binding protein n=1 Tax=Azospirillum sp. TaxID=34012 RepID=UPI002D524819|nr:branched-chain amino acid ABC transporter substrate-binding protein [Azospirillum sp.]HYF86845.1 branched-chain amino acid ABC transporter substrate-binding protein [Azospirillum sp.]
MSRSMSRFGSRSDTFIRKLFRGNLLRFGISLAALVPTAAAADVKLGLAGPVTGQYASFMEQMRRGADLAVADLNAAGGINGEKVVLQVADDACDPKQAVAVANRFVADGVQAVVGHFCSSSTIPASSVYAEAGLVIVTPASTNPTITERGLTNMFRVCGRDDQAAGVAAKQIVSRDLGRTIAIVHDKSTYGQGIAEGVRTELAQQGRNVVLFEGITQGERDFSSLVARMRALNVDVVFFGGYHTEAGLLVRQAAEQGLKTRFVAGDGLATTEFAAIAGPASDGVMFTFYPDPRVNAGTADLVQRFRAAGFEPEGFTLYTYAAVNVLADAAKAAKTMKGDRLAAALRAGTYRTVLGDIRFDQKGDPNSEPFVLYAWNNGTYAPLK